MASNLNEPRRCCNEWVVFPLRWCTNSCRKLLATKGGSTSYWIMGCCFLQYCRESCDYISHDYIWFEAFKQEIKMFSHRRIYIEFAFLILATLTRCYYLFGSSTWGRAFFGAWLQFQWLTEPVSERLIESDRKQYVQGVAAEESFWGLILAGFFSTGFSWWRENFDDSWVNPTLPWVTLPSLKLDWKLVGNPRSAGSAEANGARRAGDERSCHLRDFFSFFYFILFFLLF